MFSLIELVFLQVDTTPVTTDSAIMNSVIRILMLIIFGSLFLWLYKLARVNLLRGLVRKLELNKKQARNLIILLSAITLTMLVLLIMYLFDFDPIIHKSGDFHFVLSHILMGLLLLMVARLFDYIIAGYFTKAHQTGLKDHDTHLHDKTTSKADVYKGRRMLQSIVIAFFLYYIVQVAAIDTKLFDTEVGKQHLPVTLSLILRLALIFLVGRLIAWFMTGVVFYNYYKRRNLNIGARFAINQIVTYVIYLVTVIVMINSLHVNMGAVWTGIAALLVGVGLGLQYTINDFFSGLILLFERGVEVGDVLYLKDENKIYGTVTQIGLRATKVRTVDNVFLIIPNSKLISQTVSNLSHFDNKARFFVEINVRYGTDTEVVKRLLLACANEHPEVLKYSKPHVFFNNFSNSSLQFHLYFYVKNHMHIERIKSELRFSVDKAFRDNKIEIPFPQLDVWFKNQQSQ